jgi:hypothetical protein
MYHIYQNVKFSTDSVFLYQNYFKCTYLIHLTPLLI